MKRAPRSHQRHVLYKKYTVQDSEISALLGECGLIALRVFKVVQPAPGILSLIRAYRDKEIKYGLLKNTLEKIEKFHFSFNAITSSRSSGGISGMYSSFGRSVFSAKDSNEVGNVISDLIKKLQEREVAESEFIAGFEQVIYTKSHSSQKALVQYILKKTASFECQPFVGETDDLTIEHLLPQSTKRDGQDEKVIGQIGNLLLIDAKTNEMLSTKDFKQKKIILKDRGYKLPDVLDNVNAVDEDVIKQNTKRIASLARQNIWKI